MFIDTGKVWIRRLAISTVIAAGLGAMILPLASAQAQVFFNFGPFGFGVGAVSPAPFYYPQYYAPAPYYAPFYPHFLIP